MAKEYPRVKVYFFRNGFRTVPSSLYVKELIKKNKRYETDKNQYGWSSTYHFDDPAHSEDPISLLEYNKKCCQQSLKRQKDNITASEKRLTEIQNLLDRIKAGEDPDDIKAIV